MVKSIKSVVLLFVLMSCTQPTNSTKPIDPIDIDLPEDFSISIDNNSNGLLSLSWDPLNDTDTYELEYSFSESGSYVPAASCSSESFSTSALNPGETYYFRLRGKNSDNYSEYSDSINVTIPEITTPDGIDSVQYQLLEGVWRCSGTNTHFRTTNNTLLIFRSDYTLGYSEQDENGKYRSDSSMTIDSLDGSTLHFLLHRNADALIEYNYSLTDNTLTISEAAGEETTYTKINENPVCALGLAFYAEHNSNLSYDVPVYYNTANDAVTALFKSGTDRSSLVPDIRFTENCLISPLPQESNLDGVSTFRVFGNGDDYTLTLTAAARPSDNLLYNGDFSSGTDGWIFSLNTIPAANGTVNFSSGNAAIDVTGIGSPPGETYNAFWGHCISVNTSKGFITLENGKYYRLSFTGSSSDQRSVIVEAHENGRDLDDNGDSWGRYMTSSFRLTTTPREYSTTFLMNGITDDLPLIAFQSGDEIGSMIIDDVKLEEIPAPELNYSENMLPNGNFSQGTDFWVLNQYVNNKGTDPLIYVQNDAIVIDASNRSGTLECFINSSKCSLFSQSRVGAPFLTLESGTTYECSFTVTSSTGGATIGPYLNIKSDDSDSWHGERFEYLDLNGSTQTYMSELLITEDDDLSYLNIHIMDIASGTVITIDDIVLKKKN